MLRTKLLQSLRLAALALAVSSMFGSLAWGHDDDDAYYRHDEAREHGYQNGYRDGLSHGRYDRMQGYRYNIKSEQWEDADGGYQHWIGSRGHYKSAYREGYERGYSQGFNSYRYRGERDNYRRGYDRDDWR